MEVRYIFAASKHMFESLIAMEERRLQTRVRHSSLKEAQLRQFFHLVMLISTRACPPLPRYLADKLPMIAKMSKYFSHPFLR